MKKANLEVRGMYCAHCSKAVENALGQAGLLSHVDLAHNRVEFTYDEEKISLEYLRRLVKRAGYELVIDERKSFDRNKVLVPVALLVLLFSLLGIVHHVLQPFQVEIPFFFFFGNDVTFLVLATISILVLGIPFFVRAVKGLRYKNIGMDFLISLSSLASYALSLYLFVTNVQRGIDPLALHAHHMDGYRMTYFDGTCMILSIITLGHLLTDRIKLKADKNYQKAAIEPPKDSTLVYPDGTTETLDSDRLDVGDTIRVLAGDVLPCDGHVVKGRGHIDESSLTGESRPRLVQVGDKVLGGTYLQDGPIEMEVEKIALESLYSSIQNESYALDQRKGKLSKLSDTIAAYFTPSVLLIALLSFLVCLFAMKLDVEESIVRACSVLSVSCPCAFGLAVPISSMSGYDCALRHGVLFKSGDTFEKIRRIQCAVFDKTGTLSTGRMHVEGFCGRKDLLPVVKAMEKNSLHPIALSLIQWLQEEKEEEIEAVQEIPGEGLRSGPYVLGNRRSVQGKSLSAELERFEEEKKDTSLVYLSDEREVLLILSLVDELSQDSVDTIQELKRRGIHVYMVTGDRREYALQIAKRLHIDEENVLSEATPQSKASLLREIRKKEGVLCYVGDGINDTLALKEADLSFASYKANAIACSSADGLLLRPELSALLAALDISKKTYVNIIENFVWAILYNVAMIPLAVLGLLPMYLCAALMIASNLTLTINSLRVRSYRPERKEKRR